MASNETDFIVRAARAEAPASKDDLINRMGSTASEGMANNK